MMGRFLLDSGEREKTLEIFYANLKESTVKYKDNNNATNYITQSVQVNHEKITLILIIIPNLSQGKKKKENRYKKT